MVVQISCEIDVGLSTGHERQHRCEIGARGSFGFIIHDLQRSTSDLRKGFSCFENTISNIREGLDQRTWISQARSLREMGAMGNCRKAVQANVRGNARRQTGVAGETRDGW